MTPLQFFTSDGTDTLVQADDERVIPRVPEDCEGLCRALPNAGTHSDEEFYNADTDRYIPVRLKVVCPHCGYLGAPLMTRDIAVFGGGWRWVGLDYQAPYTEYVARCAHRSCLLPYKFTIQTPQ